MADRCSFCGSTAGPFHKVGGLFTVLMCADCQAARVPTAGANRRSLHVLVARPVGVLVSALRA
jgi:hypothetical protein